ncbi:MAG: YraN family protein [Clostridiales bacterium]|nr:YraN family protein [Clostridiales bacterium]
MDRKKLGHWGEQQACKYLESKGYVILDKNYRCRLGEIDLIALDGGCLVFIEVKTRTSVSYGFPAEAVGKSKQNKYIQMASIYAKEKGIYGASFRFDVVEILINKKQGYWDINHITNAFQSTGGRYYS